MICRSFAAQYLKRRVFFLPAPRPALAYGVLDYFAANAATHRLGASGAGLTFVQYVAPPNEGRRVVSIGFTKLARVSGMANCLRSEI